MQRAFAMTAMLTMLILGLANPATAQPGPPESGFQLRMGVFMPTGDSGFWDDTEEVFTLRASDFDHFILGFSFVRPISNTAEFGINVDFFEETVISQYHDWVDGAGYPIFHDSQLTVVPLTVDLRLIPGGRYRVRPGGRQIIKPLFYIGLGGGMSFWEYEEYGDFLDFSIDPPEIFLDRFVDDGVALELHALAGVEIPVGRRTNLLLEVRQSWSDDRLGGDFGSLPQTKLDLGGTSISGGLSWRF